jgi:hypothetical protein
MDKGVLIKNTKGNITVKNKLNSIYLIIMILVFTGCEQLVYRVDTIVSGQVGKGKALAGNVYIYAQDGKLLGTTNIIDGKYSLNVKYYVGNVIIDANITEYHDEKLNKPIITSPIKFSALSSIKKNSLIAKINVTPITDVTAKLLKLDISSLSKKDILDTNIYIASKIGLGSKFNPTTSDIKYINKNLENKVQANTAQTKEGWALMSISNESNLSISDSPEVIKSKVEKAIDDFYIATLNKMVDPKDETLENLYKEAYDDTGIKLTGIVNNNIVDNSKDYNNIDKGIINIIEQRAKKILNTHGSIVIIGEALEGSELLTKITDPDGLTNNIRYRWQVSKNKKGPFKDILINAKKSSFILTQNEVNKYIRVVTIYKDKQGTIESAVSNVTSAIENINYPASLTPILGIGLKGEKLRVGTVFDLDGVDAILNYEWQVSNTKDGTYKKIDDNSNKSLFVITKNEVDKYIRVKVTYFSANLEETIISKVIGPITSTNKKGSISNITGKAMKDIRLTAGDISDKDGFNYDVIYQWQVSDDINGKYKAIKNANEVSFVLTQAEVGKYIRVVGIYTDNNGTRETVYTDPIGAIEEKSDNIALEVYLFNPPNGKQNVSSNTTKEIEINFNKNIIKKTNKFIYVYTDVDNIAKIVSRVNVDNVNVDKNKVSIPLDVDYLKYGAVHYVHIDIGAFKDINTDNDYLGIQDNDVWKFTVENGPCGCDQLDNCNLDEKLQN